MPLPLVKIVVSLMRTLAWPIVSVAMRRLKANPLNPTRNFFYAFGLKAFRFECWLERTII